MVTLIPSANNRHTTMEIKSYMTRIGQQARQAAGRMAKADTATKNRALAYIAESDPPRCGTVARSQSERSRYRQG